MTTYLHHSRPKSYPFGMWLTCMQEDQHGYAVGIHFHYFVHLN